MLLSQIYHRGHAADKHGAIAEALTKVSPQECENYLANQGYRRQL
jgi:hypothetical protein